MQFIAGHRRGAQIHDYQQLIQTTCRIWGARGFCMLLCKSDLRSTEISSKHAANMARELKTGTEYWSRKQEPNTGTECWNRIQEPNTRTEYKNRFGPYLREQIIKLLKSKLNLLKILGDLIFIATFGAHELKNRYETEAYSKGRRTDDTVLGTWRNVHQGPCELDSRA